MLSLWSGLVKVLESYVTSLHTNFAYATFEIPAMLSEAAIQVYNRI